MLRMIIVFDFDRTLFDAQRFKDDLKAVFVNAGLAESVFDETFTPVRANKDGYSIDKQLKVLKSYKDVSMEQLNQVQMGMKMVLRHSQDYVFADVLPLLEKFSNQALYYVLTFGNKEFQIEKLQQAGLDAYFQQIVSTLNETKVDEFKDICNANIGEDIYYIDDKVIVVEPIHVACPNAHVALLDRANDGRKANGIKTVHSLTEFAELIENKQI